MITNFYDEEQLRSWMIQFANIFTGLTVKTGKGGQNETEEIIKVPVIYRTTFNNC